MIGSLTAVATEGTAVRMGRPPLNLRETKIYLSADQKARIEAIAGINRMSAWIRAAIDSELDRQEADARNARSKKTD